MAFILGIVLSCGAAVLLINQAPNHFQATARLMLLLPPDARREPINPFLDQPNGLVVLGNVAAEIPYSDEVRDALLQLGLSNQFEVGLDPTNPIITLSVQGLRAETVEATRDWLVSRIQQELHDVQVAVMVPSRQLATAHVFMAGPAHRIRGHISRGAAGVVAAGFLLSILLSLWLAAPRRGWRA